MIKNKLITKSLVAILAIGIGQTSINNINLYALEENQSNNTLITQPLKSIKNDIDCLISEAIKAVSKAKQTGDVKDIDLAKSKIKLLPKSDIKDELFDSIGSLINEGSIPSTTLKDTFLINTSNTTPTNTVRVTGWINEGGMWYYINSTTGIKATGWLQTDGKWYYLNQLGVMQTGWVSFNGTWYYLYTDGTMASNTTIDVYTLGCNGALV